MLRGRQFWYVPCSSPLQDGRPDTSRGRPAGALQMGAPSFCRVIAICSKQPYSKVPA